MRGDPPTGVRFQRDKQVTGGEHDWWCSMLESHLSTFLVNFEPFCGDIKLVERPDSRGEEELAAKRRDPPTRYAARVGQMEVKQWEWKIKSGW